MKACFCHIDKFNLHFGRRGSRSRSFCNILLATASSLHHLIDCSVVLSEICVGKIESDIIDTFSLLISYQFAEVTFFGRNVSAIAEMRFFSYK